MEQYFLPFEHDFKNLRFALDNYSAQRIFIRHWGSGGGGLLLDEQLENKILDFEEGKNIRFLIDGQEAFNLKYDPPRKDVGFTLAYERRYADGMYVMLPTGTDPYDSELPEPNKSILRNGLDWKLIEITFEGRINLEFLKEKEGFSYWKIVGSNE